MYVQFRCARFQLSLFQGEFGTRRLRSESRRHVGKWLSRLYKNSLTYFWCCQPYTYDACDVGTTPNQTLNNLPTIATTSGDTNAPYNGELSYLPGQRLSRCTCAGESHPGPVHASDGSYVGRSAPEIDVFGLSVFYSECL